MKLEELVNKNYDNFNENDLYIWKYIVANKKLCSTLTIDELAMRCNVSRTTILRFAKKLTLKGYSELKIYLKWSIDETKENTENFSEVICNDFIKFVSDMKEKDFTKVCDLIYNAKRVFVYGTGAVQSAVAGELKRIFLSGQECFYSIHGDREAEILLSSMTREDVIIIISLTGESDHIRSLARKLNIKDIPIISITKLKNNELARVSHENLYINTSIGKVGNGTEYESTSLFFTLVEILFSKYVEFKNNKLR
ncbi:MurR/RpiR family transcriptional regulator [Clostridium sp.]|uniref:MurR/RpiR family transcriptional regulator n=1 Tax=Clostridium sp. TaxID=1506 RepID=UPI0039918A5F